MLLALHDRLVADLGTCWLFPRLRRVPAELRVANVLVFLDHAAEKRAEAAAWSDHTRTAVAQKYAPSVRDFGLARGTVRKITVRPALYGAPVRLSSAPSVSAVFVRSIWCARRSSDCSLLRGTRSWRISASPILATPPAFARIGRGRSRHRGGRVKHSLFAASFERIREPLLRPDPGVRADSSVLLIYPPEKELDFRR